MTGAVLARDAISVRTGHPRAKDIGVRVTVLRKGSMTEPLFLVPGLDGDSDELAGLAAALATRRAIIALAPAAFNSHCGSIDTIEQMADLVFRALRKAQPSGPYYIGGYSFGALVALEVGRRLRVAGAEVAGLFLIEPVFDERYWPRRIWLGALMRRTVRQLIRIVRMPPLAAMSELRLRAVRLAKRIAGRAGLGDGGIRSAPVGAMPVRGNALTAIGRYRPLYYDGAVMLISAAVDRHFGCVSAALWNGLAAQVEVRRIAGDHLSIVRAAASVTAVAELIDRRLAAGEPSWPGLTPVPGFARPMLLTTMRWFSTARLAHSLAESGFAVTVCRPAWHPLRLVEGLAGQYRLGASPLRSLRSAIQSAAPDIILPDDERAIRLLRKLLATLSHEDMAMAALIVRSLGGEGDWPIMMSRAGLIAEAERLGVACPATVRIASVDALAPWAMPFLLKTDGSWGGRGVAIVRQAERLLSTWRSLSSPPPAWRALKRLLINLDTGSAMAWLRQEQPVVNVQAYIEGRPGIATVACLDGRILGLACLEVLQTADATGPATVVRAIDHPGMVQAAERIVGRFGLSGFCGFDFLLDEQGTAQLIELNPRVTPTCHLLVEGNSGGVLALFPQELLRDPQSQLELDIPKRAPDLLRGAMAIVRRRGGLVSRQVRRLEKRYAAAK